MTKKEYLHNACEMFDCTPEYYIKDMEDNFVIILQDGKPMTFDNGDVVIFGDREEAEEEADAGKRVITELDYFNSLK